MLELKKTLICLTSALIAITNNSQASLSNTLPSVVANSHFLQEAILLAQSREENEALAQQYQDLEYLLSKRRWNEADKTTSEIVLKITGREDECRLFRILDNLWGKYYVQKTGRVRDWQYRENHAILEKNINCRLSELIGL